MTVFGITRFSDSSILLISVALPLEHNLSSLVSVASQIRRFTGPDMGPVYVVVDLRGCDVTLSDALLLIEEYKAAEPDWNLTTSITFIAVGIHPLIRVGIRRIWEQLNIHIRQFDVLSEALNYARNSQK